MRVTVLKVEVGDAGLHAIIESSRRGELTPIAFVVLRNLAVQAQRALDRQAAELADELAAKRPPPPSIREEWLAA